MNKAFDKNEDYGIALDNLRFSQEDKEAMIQKLTNTDPNARQETAKRTARRPMRRAAVVAAAAVLVLCVGAGAATGALKTVAEAFSGVFGGGAAETELMDQMGVPVGASDSAGGVTITADAILGDKYNYAVIYSLTKDDGTAFDVEPGEHGYLPLRFQDMDIPAGMPASATGTAYFFDADPADNAIQYVELMSADKKPSGTATAKFQDLIFDDGRAAAHTLATGDWTLKFKMDYPDSGVNLSAGQDFQVNGMDATLDAVMISPLGIRIDYTVNEEALLDQGESGRVSDAAADKTDQFTQFPVTLTKTDGTVVDLYATLGSGMQVKTDKTLCNKGGLFDAIIPLEDIASVTVGDVVLPAK